jgi:DNA repair exonuclease SbcCD ATPase subunit
MVIFEKIRYKNILSTGNAFTEIVLNGEAATLLVGSNGVGKSTFLDALCFGLYGKPFRNINRPTLVNSINQKNLVVEVEFTTQNNKYLIRRGIKPTIFDIMCNGTVIPELPSTIEMQDYLEKYILKCNFKAFTQVVILGASSYVPFMRLTPQARREILEDILDIEVFSVMQSLLKDRLVNTKEKLTKTQSDYHVAESAATLIKKYTDHWVAQQEEKRATIESAIAINSKAIAIKDASLRDIKAEISTVQYDSILTDLRQKHKKATSLIAKFTNEIRHYTKDYEFFHDNDACPTCTQQLDPKFKTSKCITTEEKLQEATRNKDEVIDIALTLEKKITKVEDQIKNHQILLVKRNQLETELAALDIEFDRLAVEHKKTFEPAPEPPQNISDCDALRQEVESITEEKHVLEQGAVLLKDTGIRTRIIAQYLPVINAWVNKYLTALDFPIQFTLDEQFKETIKSRHRDEFSYENFSEGEKRRVDLALILAWRAVARLKNSVYTNLLIFDEIFDSSLDVSGIEEFMRLLRSFDKGTNVFIISHKDAMVDKFSSVLTVTKVKGFSEIK